MPVPPDLRRGALGDDLDRLTGGQQQRRMRVRRSCSRTTGSCSSQRLAHLDDARDELTREPLGVTMPAVEGAEHEGDVPDAIQRYRSADHPVRAQGRDRAGFEGPGVPFRQLVGRATGATSCRFALDAPSRGPEKGVGS